MAVDPDMLEKILGAPDSPTGKLVALRQTPPATGDLQTGVWYSNFSRVKTEAERRGLPFIGMWTNGDLCGFCRRFTANMLEDTFVAWFQGEPALFWLGGSMDDNEEDGRGGKGFTWCRGPEQAVSYFPFFSVSKIVGGREEYAFYGSGNDYDERKAAPYGTPKILIKIHNIMHADRPIVVPKIAGVNDTPAPAAVAPTQVSAPVTAPMPGPLSVTQTPTPTSAATTGRLSIRVNPDWDAAHLARFQEALAKTGGHCPCRADRSPETKCMCKAFLDQTTPGRCHCGAYEKYTV